MCWLLVGRVGRVGGKGGWSEGSEGVRSVCVCGRRVIKKKIYERSKMKDMFIMGWGLRWLSPFL